MIINNNNIEKQKRLFQKMAPEELGAYCEQHPCHSLATDVRTQRTFEACDIMEDCAKELSIHTRKILAIYIQETFKHGDVKVKPTILHAIYAPLLERADFEKGPLTKAINEFLAK